MTSSTSRASNRNRWLNKTHTTKHSYSKKVVTCWLNSNNIQVDNNNNNTNNSSRTTRISSEISMIRPSLTPSTTKPISSSSSSKLRISPLHSRSHSSSNNILRILSSVVPVMYSSKQPNLLSKVNNNNNNNSRDWHPRL